MSYLSELLKKQETFFSQGNWVVETTENCVSMSLPFVCKQSLLTLPSTPDPGQGTCDPGYIAYGTNCYHVQVSQINLEENNDNHK